MKQLVILGNYTLSSFFSRAAGPFNVTLLGVDSEGVAEIEVNEARQLQATDSKMDMYTTDMVVDFKNLGFMGSMFQGMVSGVGTFLFDSMKPAILDKVNTVIRNDVNKKIKDISTKFMRQMSPVDLAVAEGRKYVRDQGYDPYKLADHKFAIANLINVNITEFWLQGLSRFYRVGNLSLSMDAGIIQIGVHVLTEQLKGHCIWSVDAFGISKSERTDFTVEHLQLRALVNQSLDIRTRPQLDDLDIEMGKVVVKMDPTRHFNVMIETVINKLPKLIRHIIVDTLEEPIKERVQMILNEINIQAIVDSKLPELDNYGL